MKHRQVQARVLLSSAKTPDPWFGIKYTMNLYRGCQHRCIYCDSRSECYGIEDFDGEVLVKANALELLDSELPRKRTKGYIGTGSMNDPYMPLERELCMTRRALEIIARHGFPVHILTKSDMVLRDLDVLDAIRRATSPAGAVVSFTITTADDDLARRIEPGAPPSSARFRALAAVSAAGLRCGVMLMPILPFIEDSIANVTDVVVRAHAAGATYVVPAFGMTLRDRQRTHYYAQLDHLFPGLRASYERSFGGRYSAASRNARQLELVFSEAIARLGLERRVEAYRLPVQASTQPMLFTMD